MGLESITSLFGKEKKRDDVVAIEWGSRIIKAVHIKRMDDRLVLVGYIAIETPHTEKGLTAEELAEQLGKIRTTNSDCVLVLGNEHARMVYTELPNLPAAELRTIARLGSKNHFQEDLSGYFFDCLPLPDAPSPHTPPPPPPPPPVAEGETAPAPVPEVVKPSAGKKVKTLVAAGKPHIINDFRQAARDVNLPSDYITLGQVSLVNAAIYSLGSSQANQPVVLLDLGSRHSVINVLIGKQLALTRVIHWGAEKLIKGLAEGLNITPTVAESLIVMMPDKVGGNLAQLVTPLTDEVAATINFFEHQFEQKVDSISICGGLGRSALVVQLIQNSLMIPCQGFNPLASIEVGVPGDQEESLKKEAPQLGGAIGAALAWFNPELLQLNLLVEEVEEKRQQKPIKQAWVLSTFAVILALFVVIGIQAKVYRASMLTADADQELQAILKKTAEFTKLSTQVREVDKTIHALEKRTVYRFLFAPMLNALQYCNVEGVQVVRMHFESVPFFTPGVPGSTNALDVVTQPKKAVTSEHIRLTIQAKDFTTPGSADRFIEKIAVNRTFKPLLRKNDSVLLKERLPRQADPLRPERSFFLFQIECAYEDLNTPDD